MENLMVIISELEAEKERLLNEKEKNIEIIKSLDAKIDYYRYIIGYYARGIYLRQCQIESYKNILDFSKKRHNSLFSFQTNFTDSYMEKKISKLKSESEDIAVSKKTVSHGVIVLRKNKTILENRNEEIDLRVSVIDLELEKMGLSENDEKVYKLERGNENDRH